MPVVQILGGSSVTSRQVSPCGPIVKDESFMRSPPIESVTPESPHPQISYTACFPTFQIGLDCRPHPLPRPVETDIEVGFRDLQHLADFLGIHSFDIAEDQDFL